MFADKFINLLKAAEFQDEMDSLISETERVSLSAHEENFGAADVEMEEKVVYDNVPRRCSTSNVGFKVSV